MLVTVHETIKRLFHERGNISPSDVDISFDAPTKEWIERLIRPTLSLFLFDVRENVDLRQTSFQSTRLNGRAERRLPPRRIDLRYLVSAHTTETDDEHRLLWRALATLMKAPELPVAILPEELLRYDVPLAVRVAQSDDSSRLLDLWGGLGTEPHPAFCCVVTAPLDVDLMFETPLILTRSLRFGRGNGADAEHIDIQIGGVVRDGEGNPVGDVTVAIEGSAVSVLTDAEGVFVLRNVPSGSVRLRVAPPNGAERLVPFTVPADRYDIVLS